MLETGLINHVLQTLPFFSTWSAFIRKFSQFLNLSIIYWSMGNAWASLNSKQWNRITVFRLLKYGGNWNKLTSAQCRTGWGVTTQRLASLSLLFVFFWFCQQTHLAPQISIGNVKMHWIMASKWVLVASHQRKKHSESFSNSLVASMMKCGSGAVTANSNAFVNSPGALQFHSWFGAEFAYICMV